MDEAKTIKIHAISHIKLYQKFIRNVKLYLIVMKL